MIPLIAAPLILLHIGGAVVHLRDLRDFPKVALDLAISAKLREPPEKALRRVAPDLIRAGFDIADIFIPGIGLAAPVAVYLVKHARLATREEEERMFAKAVGAR